jgi:sulfofructose kinase
VTHSFDILGLGCSAVDDLLYVDSFPAVDQKIVVNRRERQCGGLTATALVAAARLGARCAYAGVLGNDDLSQFVERTLIREGIDATHVTRDPEFRAIHSIIIVGQDTGSRNIFPYLKDAKGFGDHAPPADLIRAAKAIFIDHVDAEGMIRAATIARDANVPVVADLESNRSPAFGKLLDLVDHLIVSRDFALKLTGAPDPASAAQKLWSHDRRAIVVTCGTDGCWYVDDSTDHTARHIPAYKVETIDTTGCGDVFHGAYTAALVQSQPMEFRLRLASATAAIKATHPGGQSGIPRRDEIETFLRSHPTTQP